MTTVVEVRLEENEPIENALKRFKKVVQNSGLISEMKKREFYEKPSERRKKRENERHVGQADRPRHERRNDRRRERRGR